MGGRGNPKCKKVRGGFLTRGNHVLTDRRNVEIPIGIESPHIEARMVDIRSVAVTVFYEVIAMLLRELIKSYMPLQRIITILSPVGVYHLEYFTGQAATFSRERRV